MNYTLCIMNYLHLLRQMIPVSVRTLVITQPHRRILRLDIANGRQRIIDAWIDIFELTVKSFAFAAFAVCHYVKTPPFTAITSPTI